MKLSRCPICHSHISLDQLVQDDAGRQLLGLMSKLSYHVSTSLVSYLALFRPAKRDLDNGRAYTLACEALELTSNHPILAEALRETVDGIAKKRQAGENKPMANHNYLKRVLEAKLGQQQQKPTQETVELKQSPTLSDADNNRLWREQMGRYGMKDFKAVPNE
ncbi:hypothetical protein [Rheinheimera sp.]|uniref:hypothetical protein n=1 Tax=Rheinheimera sp. TaxID=1869214 RepID=UPI00307EA25A